MKRFCYKMVCRTMFVNKVKQARLPPFLGKWRKPRTYRVIRSLIPSTIDHIWSDRCFFLQLYSRETAFKSSVHWTGSVLLVPHHVKPSQKPPTSFRIFETGSVNRRVLTYLKVLSEPDAVGFLHFKKGSSIMQVIISASYTDSLHRIGNASHTAKKAF